MRKKWYLLLALYVISVVLLGSITTVKNVEAVDATLPVEAFSHDVEIRSGCDAYTDVATLTSSSPCAFHSTNLGWRRFDLKDVNVTQGWYYQFYINYYVESTTSTAGTIQVQPIQSLNDAFDVVSFNQVAQNEYIGGFVQPGDGAGYSYTYSIIVLSNETAENASIRLGGLAGVGNIFGHFANAGSGVYPDAHITISRLHAFRPINYSAQLSEILEAIEDISLSQAGMEQAVENGVENAQENEKEQIQDASDEAEEEADDAGAEAESNTQSLLQAGSSIIDVFRNAQPSDCLIRINMGNNRLDTGTVDLCNAPTEIRNIITTILTIPITIGVLHITHSLIMIYIDRIREEQE